MTRAYKLLVKNVEFVIFREFLAGRFKLNFLAFLNNLAPFIYFDFTDNEGAEGASENPWNDLKGT